jgi:uncharacterized protein YjbI with pentapeptide repeats
VTGNAVIDLRRHLDDDPDARLPGIRFYGADMRGADLADARIACLSLRGAVLDGANLAGATLQHVDLTGASLAGASLAGATLRLVSANGTGLRGADLTRAYLDVADLTGADMREANLRDAALHGCLLNRARLDAADLTRTVLAECACAGASFRGARFRGANTACSRFAGADLDGAHDLARCRELVAEILRTLAEELDDPEAVKLVGAVSAGERWCYSEWAGLLAGAPEHREIALRFLEKYPDSGIATALKAAERLRAAHLPAENTAGQ